MSECATRCKGHRRFVGGFLDGQVDHMAGVAPNDYPLWIRFPNGSMYERELDGGTETLYRVVAT